MKSGRRARPRPALADRPPSGAERGIAGSDRGYGSYGVRGLVPVSHVFVLTGLAVAQPLYDLLSRQAEFFIAHDVQPIDPVLIALALSILLPLALVALTRAAGLLGAAAGRWLHGALVAGLSGAVALQVLKPASLGVWPSIASGAGLAVAGAALYHRNSVYRTFLTILSPAALLFPLFFLFGSPVRELVLPSTVTLAGGRSAAAAPVVMVVFDELPLVSLLDAADEVDSVRYPNLAALARDAYWFRDATTASTSTVVSVPILLSGRRPEGRGLLPQAADHPHNLFTWLGAAGYGLNVVETQTRLCPPQLCPPAGETRGLWRRLDELATDLVVIYLHRVLPDAQAGRLPSIEDRWSHFTATTLSSRLVRMLGAAGAEPARVDDTRRDGVPLQFAAFLERVAAGDRPSLHYIHLLLPHGPWRYLPSGREYGRQLFFPHGLPRKPWEQRDEWRVAQGYQRHLLQVGYADRLIGQLVARLERQGLYDSALIVVVADHGATFRAGVHKRWVARRNVADVLNVPLLIKLPGQRQPVWRDGGVNTVDVLPTMADALDLALPWPADGESALSSSASQQTSGVTHGGKSWTLSELRASRARGGARKRRLFGAGEAPGGRFRIQHRGDLLGRRVTDAGIQPVTEPAVTVELNEPWSFEALDPNAPLFPARVSGRVRFASPRADPIELAVAVGGTIEAVTWTSNHHGDRARFAAMVPERALVAGRNVIEVFEIASGKAGGLLPTRQLGAAAFTLPETEGDPAIQTPGGDLMPLIPDRAGTAKVRAEGRRVWIEGRFAGGQVGPRVENLLVFVDGRCVAVRDGELSRKRTRGAGRSGARFSIRLPDALTDGPSRVRLFAVAAGSASEVAIS